MRLDYKELANPLVLFPIIVLILFLFGFKNFIVYSFIIFFFISLANNLILVFKKIVKSNHYLFVYFELFFSLIFLIPLFLVLRFKDPFITSFFILGIADFLIQSYYNVLPRKDGKEIVKLWKHGLVKSERRWLHAISMQKYIFEDFITEILDLSKKNPTRNHIFHFRFMSPITNKKIIKHQFGTSDTIAFHIQTKFIRKNIRTYNGLLIDKSIRKKIGRISKECSKNIVTAYCYENILRIVFKRDFVLGNPEETYSFLMKANHLFN